MTAPDPTQPDSLLSNRTFFFVALTIGVAAVFIWRTAAGRVAVGAVPRPPDVRPWGQPDRTSPPHWIRP